MVYLLLITVCTASALLHEACTISSHSTVELYKKLCPIISYKSLITSLANFEDYPTGRVFSAEIPVILSLS